MLQSAAHLPLRPDSPKVGRRNVPLFPLVSAVVEFLHGRLFKSEEKGERREKEETASQNSLVVALGQFKYFLGSLAEFTC